MTEGDEYELLPQGSLEKLKSDLNKLKQGSGDVNKETIESINDLKVSINKLLQLFSVASEDMKKEEAETHGVEKKLGPLMQKVDTLVEQNQELARGLVVVADMVKEHLPKIETRIDHLKIPKPKSNMEHHKPIHHEPRRAPVHTPTPAPTFDFNPPGTMPSMVPGQQPPSHPGMSSLPPPGLPPLEPRSVAPQQPQRAPELPPLGGFDDLSGSPSPLPGMEERPKKKGLLSGLFGKK